MFMFILRAAVGRIEVRFSYLPVQRMNEQMQTNKMQT